MKILRFEMELEGRNRVREIRCNQEGYCSVQDICNIFDNPDALIIWKQKTGVKSAPYGKPLEIIDNGEVWLHSWAAHRLGYMLNNEFGVKLFRALTRKVEDTENYFDVVDNVVMIEGFEPRSNDIAAENDDIINIPF
jgi:hypothetical protein